REVFLDFLLFSNIADLLSYYIGPYQAYCLSKLVLSVFVEQLSQHRPQRIVTMHPGVVPGTLYRHTNMLVKFVTYFILPYLLRRPTFSALLVVHTALRDDLVTGSYYEDGEAKRLGDRLTVKDKESIYKCVQKQVQGLIMSPRLKCCNRFGVCCYVINSYGLRCDNYMFILGP
ncbi:hypothetical protein TELCIR_19499, partial [Teladorsagia circumcincta]